MDQKRIFKIMEIVWLSIAILSVLSAVWSISKGDIEAGKYPLFVTFCAALLFALRRYQRKRLEKSMNDSASTKK
jgi:uncharacterized membrane protein YozB (DUF420 family)